MVFGIEKACSNLGWCKDLPVTGMNMKALSKEAEWYIEKEWDRFPEYSMTGWCKAEEEYSNLEWCSLNPVEA